MPDSVGPHLSSSHLCARVNTASERTPSSSPRLFHTHYLRRSSHPRSHSVLMGGGSATCSASETSLQGCVSKGGRPARCPLSLSLPPPCSCPCPRPLPPAPCPLPPVPAPTPSLSLPLSLPPSLPPAPCPCPLSRSLLPSLTPVVPLAAPCPLPRLSRRLAVVSEPSSPPGSSSPGSEARPRRSSWDRQSPGSGLCELLLSAYLFHLLNEIQFEAININAWR